MARHGGNLRELAERAGAAPAEILDFSASINPLGPPTWLSEAVSAALPAVQHYPDPDCVALRGAVAEALGTAPENVLPVNGSNELLYALPRALRPRRLLVCSPCYAGYADGALAAGCPVVGVPLRHGEGVFLVDCVELGRCLQAGDMLVLGHPNNPTGGLLDTEEVLALAHSCPDAWVVVDEAFVDFVGEECSIRHGAPANLLVLRSLTKFYAIPGLRLGLMLAAPGVVQTTQRQIPDWSVNSLAAAVGARAVLDTGYARQTRDCVRLWCEELLAGLRELPGLRPCPGHANFLFVEWTAEGSVGELAARLLREHRVAIRVWQGKEGAWFRVAVRRPEENRRLLAALASVLDAGGLA